jgi:hypothetical protein
MRLAVALLRISGALLVSLTRYKQAQEHHPFNH